LREQGICVPAPPQQTCPHTVGVSTCQVNVAVAESPVVSLAVTVTG